MDERLSIGERIKQLRGADKKPPLLSQRELAEKAGVSIEVIRQLEQGKRARATILTLQKIAQALDVEIGDLTDKPKSLPDVKDNSGVVAIRRALTPVDDLTGDVVDETTLSIEDAKRTTEYLWGAYWAGKYELLGRLIPDALSQLRATVRAVPLGESARASEYLAHAYQVAGDTLVHLGQSDAAFLGIRKALEAAENGDDPLLFDSLKLSVSWQLLVQGRYDESERVATVAACSVEPHGDTSDSQLSLYGLFAVTAATASARNQKADTTNELLKVASEAANRLGYERSDHSTTFGPTKVAMLTVDSLLVQQSYSRALATSKTLKPHVDKLPLASRARHLVDMAQAHTRLGQNDKALTLVLTAKSLAPQWMKYQAFPREVVGELLEHERPTPLRELAQELGVVR